MSYPIQPPVNHANLDVLSFPKRPGIFEFLWLVASPSGFYGRENGTPIVVTNARHELVELSRLIDTQYLTIIALDSGGHSIKSAGALRIVDPKITERLIEGIPGSSDVFIPIALADSFGWQEGIRVGSHTLRLTSNSISEMITLQSKKAEKRSSRTYLTTNILTALRLCIGQIVWFSIPLMIFGWVPLLLGSLGAIASALLLAITWRMFRLPGILRGLIIGVVLAAIAILVLPSLFTLMVTITFALAGIVLAISTWMGVVISGVSPEVE